MADTFLQGWLALGSLSGNTFTEITVTNGSYARQPVALVRPQLGTVSMTNPVQFAESAGVAFGAISAVAICDAATSGLPVFFWNLPAPIIRKAYENVSFDVGLLDFTFFASTGLAAPELPFSSVNLTAGTICGATTAGMPVFVGEAVSVNQ